MNQNTVRARADQQYAAAYEMHYKTKNLHEALRLYAHLAAAHPKTREAEYSHTQIANIVRSVVPRQDLEDAQVSLARAHLGQTLPARSNP